MRTFLEPLHAQARSQVVPVAMDASPVRGGERVHLIGLNKSLRAMARSSSVINACFPLSIAPIEVPRFRAVNEEVRPPFLPPLP